ncbi:hypothetical protein [Haliscomenobacter hydrossis]|uniref:Uncharacterized protein n=1 Tax=Haliscomenobacter hydrossis (strain ATCC 27775 / DSM 1100 / LMG 10767 / O) TaxID=760192 RepID=F4L2B0_HALH1|nr:hypothetical protein [Haliscomenobacter hydrossis]AEE52863.1 hypothetical protein Halhy_5037 [Haliscomenobacter hydrossis DSM 1100]
MRKPIEIDLSKKLDEKKGPEITTPSVPVEKPKWDKKLHEADKKIFKRLGAAKTAIVVLMIACLWYGQFRHIPPLIKTKPGITYLKLKEKPIHHSPEIEKKMENLAISPELGVSIPRINPDICFRKPPITNIRAEIWKGISFKETSAIIFISGHGSPVSGLSSSLARSPLTPIMDSLGHRIAQNESLKVMQFCSLTASALADSVALQSEIAKNIPDQVQSLLLSFELKELTESSGKNWDQVLPNNEAKMSISIKCSNLRNGEVLFEKIMTQQTSLPVWAGFAAADQPNEEHSLDGSSPARLKVQQELVNAVYHLFSKYLN